MSDASAPRPDGQLLDHVYDGIREYDNPLPGWWSWFFIATIVFSAGYGFCASPQASSTARHSAWMGR
jgi:hypothetical protein